MVILSGQGAHDFEGGTIKPSLNALKVRSPFDHVIHDMAMALSDDEVIDVLPRDSPPGCAEASRRRPPPES
eukprot:824245-Amphidinium_carterae.1